MDITRSTYLNKQNKIHRSALTDMNRIECIEYNSYIKMHILRLIKQFAQINLNGKICPDQNAWKKIQRTHKKDVQIISIE